MSIHNNLPQILGVRRSLEGLVLGERRNQRYFFAASLAGLLVAIGLILWSARSGSPGDSAIAKDIVSGALPLIGSALSVTRIAASESKIAQYRAAAVLEGEAGELPIELLRMTLLPRDSRRQDGLDR